MPAPLEASPEPSGPRTQVSPPASIVQLSCSIHPPYPGEPARPRSRRGNTGEADATMPWMPPSVTPLVGMLSSKRGDQSRRSRPGEPRAPARVCVSQPDPLSSGRLLLQPTPDSIRARSPLPTRRDRRLLPPLYPGLASPGPQRPATARTASEDPDEGHDASSPVPKESGGPKERHLERRVAPCEGALHCAHGGRGDSPRPLS